jgi:proline iminopeptidase
MYPPISPKRKLFLNAGQLKDKTPIRVYYEMSGNLDGIPVIYLHGGPGDHTGPPLRRLFNPAIYNIVMMDQRGCGRSTPRNHLEKNTTAHLLKDIAAIQATLGRKVVLAGGSWGTSLAMLYAIKYPTRVAALILRGVYDLSGDTDVLDAVFPDKKAAMDKLIPKRGQTKQVTRVLAGKASATRRKLVKLLADPASIHVISAPQKSTYADDFTLSIVGDHYEANHYFVPRNTIYKGLHKIKNIPTFMVNGRFDVVTPAEIAYKVCSKLNVCSLEFVKGGHTYHEPEVSEALTRASDKCAKMLSGASGKE